MKKVMLIATALLAIACAKKGDESASKADAAPSEQTAEARLDAALTAQSEKAKARYPWRHPKETLQFFGIAPGMTVVDVLPGEDGYYTKILLPYLGPGGSVIGADYDIDMWPLFGEFAPDLEKQKTWADDWMISASGWRGENDAAVAGFAFGAVPVELKGTADAVLFIRALHHLNRLEEEGGFFTAALKDTMDLLKPGGIVGVVQHRAPAANSDEWSEGDNGYLKQDQVIAFFEGAGFRFEGSSEINANPNDKPTESEFVWRLPPTLATSRDNPELEAQMRAIGESDRMTLKFVKPE